VFLIKNIFFSSFFVKNTQTYNKAIAEVFYATVVRLAQNQTEM
jgi:hypothetical protein